MVGVELDGIPENYLPIYKFIAALELAYGYQNASSKALMELNKHLLEEKCYTPANMVNRASKAKAKKLVESKMKSFKTKYEAMEKKMVSMLEQMDSLRENKREELDTIYNSSYDAMDNIVTTNKTNNMVDMTKCDDKECKIKKGCYRYNAKDSVFNQSYFTHSPKNKNGDCKQFLEIYKDE